MFYLIGAISFNVVRTFVMKYSESNSGNRYGVTFINYLVGTILGYLLMSDKTLIVQSSEGLFTLGFSAVDSFVFVACLVLMQHNIKINGAPLTATFSRMGIIIPIIVSALLFNEVPSMLKITGIVISLLAVIYMNSGEKNEASKKGAIALILLFISGGIEELMTKLFNVFGNADYQERFVFYTFLFSAVISLLLCIRSGGKLSKRDIIAGVCVGIPNQLAALCIVKAVGELPAYIVYPCYSASVIFTVNVINFLVFREKLSKKEYIATGIIAFALILINI